MNIRTNPKTGETSINLTAAETRCLRKAEAICRAIQRVSDVTPDANTTAVRISGLLKDFGWKKESKP